MRLLYVLCCVNIVLPLQFAVAGVTESSSTESSGNYEFNDAFVNRSGANTIDLQRFANGTNVLPGTYKIIVTLNTEKLTIADVEFRTGENKSVDACIPAKVFELIEFKKEQIKFTQWDVLVDSKKCTRIQDIIPQATQEFDSEAQQLNLSIPQVYINKLPRGSVPSSMWDSGIPALMLGYNMNGYESKNNNYESKSFYASIDSGLNIGGWYLRHNGSWNWTQEQGGKYSVLNTYVQRDVPVIMGRMSAGQLNTSGQLFDTVPVTGAEVASDERMLPQSQRGYAPEIRGVAKTNAKVTIKQNGQRIYETTVSPGAFVISDLYPTGYGGNLDVTIEEADGTQQNFSIPYSSVSQLLRPGSVHYSFSAGKLRNDSVPSDPSLLEATWQQGFTNRLTGYTGVQANQDYQAVKIGLALGFPIGAVAFDVTQSKTQLPGRDDMSGQSYQLSYSKLIAETNSNITLAAYRFSSSGYMDYLTAMQTRDDIQHGNDGNQVQRQKNRFTLNISQGLEDGWGQLYVSATMENYWNKGSVERQYQIGYSNSYKWLNYSLNVSRSQDEWGKSQTSYYLNFSFPLWENQDMGTYAPQLSMNYNHDSDGGSSEQATLSGTLGAQNQYTYSVSGSHDDNSGSRTDVGGTYKSSLAALSATYSQGRDYHSASVGMTGTLVAHSGGITLSPYTGDTFTLVEAKGAEGAAIPSYPGVTIDRFGYALFPATNPYQLSDVVIDPKGISENTELENTSQKIVPRFGAVVKAKFDARRGRPVLIHADHAGQTLPFGADVFDDNGVSVGVVSQGSLIYARVPNDKGTLHIKWGDDADEQCSVSYALAPESESTKKTAMKQFVESCR
ncbi:fimbria/pilus outer membrane usher protein [Citrobacter amalonaticus]|uniref:fimbria/pilus outer membrane usher protein n=1 Tax=Citrobacter amalonaticus TaxID=35703 RepID=UPI001F48C199|nr:fimbria/pilus outer membrane usher protein [Citrobacter amalonaticus]